MYDICIIGGGASGMTAAIKAKMVNPSLSIVIVEKKPELGKKIMASGNGKCNLSNQKCQNYERTSQFFSEIGVVTKIDDAGRVYPYNEDAKSVAYALAQNIKALGIKVLTDAQVLSVSRNDGFSVHTSKDTINAKKVLLATGGKAGPAFGTTGDGYAFAKAFGHQIHKPIPVLTAVDTEEDVSELAGIRAKAVVSLYTDQQLLFQEQGEIQFTKTGLSGICVFNLSRFLLIPEGKTLQDGFKQYQLFVDFLPNVTDLEAYLSDHPEGLYSLVKKPIAEKVIALTQGDVKKKVQLLHQMPFTPSGVKGWDFAQVTKGGVPVTEIDADTMESKKETDLYIAGELLDYDGPCGGFNLQNAWETGLIAGEAMAHV